MNDSECSIELPYFCNKDIFSLKNIHEMYLALEIFHIGYCSVTSVLQYCPFEVILNLSFQQIYIWPFFKGKVKLLHRKKNCYNLTISLLCKE